MAELAMVRIAILISGRGSNMLCLSDATKRLGIKAKIVVVISNKDCNGIRKAKKLGLSTKVFKPNDFDNQADQEAKIACIIKNCRTDYIFLAGYMAVLGSEFIDQFSGKIINIHPSLLPAFRGLSTHQRVIDSGLMTHGVTIHLVTKKLDDGPMILQVKLRIRPNDNVHSLAARILNLEHQIYPFILFCLCKQFLHLSPNGASWNSPSTALANAPESITRSLANNLIWPSQVP